MVVYRSILTFERNDGRFFRCDIRVEAVKNLPEPKRRRSSPRATINTSNNSVYQCVCASTRVVFILHFCTRKNKATPSRTRASIRAGVFTPPNRDTPTVHTIGNRFRSPKDWALLGPAPPRAPGLGEVGVRYRPRQCLDPPGAPRARRRGIRSSENKKNRTAGKRGEAGCDENDGAVLFGGGRSAVVVRACLTQESLQRWKLSVFINQVTSSTLFLSELDRRQFFCLVCLNPPKKYIAINKTTAVNCVGTQYR